ncbi:MAG: PHP domain-containing protein [Chthoniobacterales bacterium]
MMTEHDRGFSESRLAEYRSACAAASSENFLVVPGIEYSDAANTVHVLTWGCPRFLGEGVPTSELLARVRAEEGIAVLAHPSRLDAWKQFDPQWSANLLGIELWNRKTDGWAPSRTAPGLFAQGRLANFAGLDFHDRRQFFPLSMRVKFAGDVNEQSVIEAFRSGRAEASVFGKPIPFASVAFATAEQLRRPLAKLLRRFRRQPSASETRTAKEMHAT